MFKRIFLFLTINILVMLTLSFLLNIFGVHGYLTAYGIDYQSLMVFCLVYGMGGAFISLLMSKMMAKWMMGVQIIDPNTNDRELGQLVQTVHRLSRDAGLGTMPEVGIYDSPELNAFATGPTRSHALVAVSSGLLSRMTHEEVEGVLGHEISLVANGDMVTMTLIQGIMNAFVMFLSRALAFVIAQALRGDRDRDREGGGINHLVFFVVQMILEVFFMILASMVVALFSRWREFRADAGSAKLAGRQKMISALQALQRVYEQAVPEQNPAFSNLKITSKPRGLMRFFSSHPPLEERIERLRAMG